MAEAKERKCPLCGKKADDRFHPFCSKRCADLDLGKWFTESYIIETEEVAQEQGTEPF